MARDERPRTLVGTLYCGENEFEALKESLQAQTYSHWEHVVYKNLPNKEAHDRLYRTFMDQQDDFDLFLKLDADMVFRSSEGLRRIVDLFQETDELDHLTLAVRDWYSDSLIEGLHTFSDRAFWPERKESRFVDSSPDVPGRHLKLWGGPAPVVDHSPDPSPFQAFRFGVHRALKVVQPGRWKLRYGQTRGQWKLLQRCWRHFVSEGDHRLGLAILGADVTLAGDVRPKHYDEVQEPLQDIFQDYENVSAQHLYTRLSEYWDSEMRSRMRYLYRVGPVRLAASALYYLAYTTKNRLLDSEGNTPILKKID